MNSATVTATSSAATTTSSDNVASDQLENKLRTTAATYRQQRDEAHRVLQLAEERLRLVRDEVKGVGIVVEATKKNLQTLRSKAGGSTTAKEERESLQREVQHLTKEVHFQHTELIQKRSKLEVLQQEFGKGMTQRKNSLIVLQNVVQHRRTQIHNLYQTYMTELLNTNTSQEWFRLEIDDTRLHLARWGKMIEKRAESIENAILKLELHNQNQLCIHKNYKKHFPDQTVGKEATTGIDSKNGINECKDMDVEQEDEETKESIYCDTTIKKCSTETVA